MTNEDGTLVLTLNGEIYNHAALREELVGKGHSFRSRCDAEVVLHLYEEHGMGLLERLEGMFAFALFDTRSGEVHVARDRLGIKPVHWYDDGQRFAFASELKALRALPKADLAPDPSAYWDFLTYEYVPAPKTVFARVKKLPAGYRLVWRAGETRVERWWSPAAAAETFTDEDAALAALDALLERAVSEHLVSDVPVGVFLSAGVDSTLVAHAAKRSSGAALQAFTIGFEGRKDDEAAEAAELARAMGAEHVVRRFGEDELRAGLAAFPTLFDEPFADASALPCLVLAELAAQHVKVVLSGDGGDETHAGYSRYLKRARKQSLYGAAAAVPGAAALAGLDVLASFPWARAVREEPLGRPYSAHFGIPREAKRLLVDAGGEFDDYDDYWAVREHADGLDSLRGQQTMDLATHLPEGILTKVDRTSMRYGLEVRPPLLDHRLVELALALPDSMKVRGDAQKLLLRRLLARDVPPEVSGARKRAFSVPMKKFVAEGVVATAGDVDVFGAFRVNHERLRRHFHRSNDAQVHWICAALEAFLASEAAA